MVEEAPRRDVNVVREALFNELKSVRERGVARVDSTEGGLKQLELPVVRALASDFAPDTGLVRGLVGLLEEAVSALPSSTMQAAATALFGLDQDIATFNPTEGRQRAALKYGTTVSVQDFRRRQELELLATLADELIAKSYSARNRRLGQGLGDLPTVGDQKVSRSLIHLMRTLEARQEHARPAPRNRIAEARRSFDVAQVAGDVSTAISAIDGACTEVLGGSLYRWLGQVNLDVSGPRVAPNAHQPELDYHGQPALQYIEGGHEPLTGQAVDPFFMATFPVTQREWLQFLQSFEWSPSDALTRSVDLNSSIEDASWSRPVVGVNYLDCLAYIYWLWAKTPYRFRLPTEAEWNYSVNGGGHRRFPWGDELDSEHGWFSESSVRNAICPVDHLAPCGPFGVSGLAGNIWEQTTTLYRAAEPVQDSDAVIPDLPLAAISAEWWIADMRLNCSREDWMNTEMVLKGGSYSLGAKYSAVDARINSWLFNLGEYSGLRLVVSADLHAGRPILQASPYYDELLSNAARSDTDRDAYVQHLMDQANANSVVSGCGGGAGDTPVRAQFLEKLG